jgi:hypothetical protein
VTAGVACGAAGAGACLEVPVGMGFFAGALETTAACRVRAEATGSIRVSIWAFALYG